MTNQDCIFEKAIQERRETGDRTKSLFVISPFNYLYDEMYNTIISPAAEKAGIKPQRADRAFQLGFVMCTKICRLMQEADYVLVDLTEDNPNVFYELGLAWGFAKRVVVIRDIDAPSGPGVMEVFGQLDRHVLSYRELLELPPGDTGTSFQKLLDEKAIDVEDEYEIPRKREQVAYIRNRRISFCYRGGLTDVQFYSRAIEEAAKMATAEVAQKMAEDVARKTPALDPWHLEQVPIGKGVLSDFLPEKLSPSKVLVVDVTHYADRPDTSIYFALGLSHAMGRETIPITNRGRCHDTSPFDVRGLWQVYFDNQRDLTAGLHGILTVITEQYETERNEYPLRFIWDRVFRHHARLSVFTCARATKKEEKDRPGGRTDVDKWDYTSVAELAFFLAQKYKQAEMSIEKPQEKATAELKAEPGQKKLTDSITRTLRRVHNSIIIIGSPDVNDYAEVVLAGAYGVSPYKRETCKQSVAARKQKCWKCNLAHSPKCIGKRGYLFYKKTISSSHPRNLSAFFREPPRDAKDCVLWYGRRQECSLSNLIENARGTTFGVLTLLKDRKDLFAPDEEAGRWIILLSGFTGVSTYALAKALTSLTPEKMPAMDILEKLEDQGIDPDSDGVQVLVSAEFQSPGDGQDGGDQRQLTGVKIVNVKPLFEDSGQPSAGPSPKTAAADAPGDSPAKAKTQ